MNKHSIGIALGGGGVRGFAHIPVLMLLDELNIKAHCVAGTSMGAIIGALYASGMSGKAIHEHVLQHLWLKDDDFETLYRKRKHLVKWVKAITPEWGGAGFMKADGIFAYLFDQLQHLQFEELATPFSCIACDYWSGQEVALTQGPLLPAVQASMAIPGVFAPVQHGEQLLLDGGLVNNLPYERVAAACDKCIAIDVGIMPQQRTISPNAVDIAAASLDIMQRAALDRRFEQQAPDVFIRPELDGIDIFDFYRIEDVLAAGVAAAEAVRPELEMLIDGV